jgi:hypothetical protein
MVPTVHNILLYCISVQHRQSLFSHDNQWRFLMLVRFKTPEIYSYHGAETSKEFRPTPPYHYILWTPKIFPSLLDKLLNALNFLRFLNNFVFSFVYKTFLSRGPAYCIGSMVKSITKIESYLTRHPACSYRFHTHTRDHPFFNEQHTRIHR